MLITNDKCAGEWKTVKTKSRNNANIASPSSVSPRNLSSVNFQNRFDNLMVTEVNQIEIHGSPFAISVVKLQILSLNQSMDKNNLHSIHPSGAITANESNTQSKNSIRTVPGN